jgi:hypothetical protein
VLCDEAIDAAREEAQRQLYDTHLALTKLIADEIIETGVEQYGT